jgi:hypothetical protein
VADEVIRCPAGDALALHWCNGATQLRGVPYPADNQPPDQVLNIYRRIDDSADPLFRTLPSPDDGDRAAVIAFLQSSPSVGAASERERAERSIRGSSLRNEAGRALPRPARFVQSAYFVGAIGVEPTTPTVSR